MLLMDFGLRIAVAVLLGGAIGLERQWRQRGAGLRTNALVALGSAAFVALSTMIVEDQGAARVVGQVVTGIGFLGGGVILREGLNVRGLTTAATLWCTAAVGTLAGAGFLGAAVVSSFVVIGTNVFLRPISVVINRRPLKASEVQSSYRFQLTCLSQEEHRIRAVMLQAVGRKGLVLQAMRSEEVSESNQSRLQADLVISGGQEQVLEELTTRLSLEPGIRAVSWEILDRNGKDELQA
ncbi:MgtC/SapB family protein [Candidatus Nitrospira bockiana]